MQGEEQLRKPVEHSTTMQPHPEKFVMISKTYSDGISVRKDGPLVKKEFSSVSILDKGRTFQTAATFIPKQVPKHFVTTLTVADELTYYECIAFERRTVMKNFSETTNIFFPKDKITKYISVLLYDPDATTKYYTVGIELLPAQKCGVTTEELKCEADATECREKNAVNGDIDSHQQLINGEM